MGEKVRELVDGEVSAGEHTITFTAGNLASGIYIYHIIADPLSGKEKFVSVKKMVLLR